MVHEHIVLSINNKYKVDGGTIFAPVLHAYMDTRFLPDFKSGIVGGMRFKEVVDLTLKGLRSDYPCLMESLQLRIVVSEISNRHFIDNVLKTYLPNNVRFCDITYRGTNEEKIASRDCSFELSVLRITTYIFSFSGESSSEMALRICGGRKMLDIHYPGLYVIPRRERIPMRLRRHYSKGR